MSMRLPLAIIDCETLWIKVFGSYSPAFFRIILLFREARETQQDLLAHIATLRHMFDHRQLKRFEVDSRVLEFLKMLECFLSYLDLLVIYGVVEAILYA
jgi:hypothetical protein